MVSPMQSFCKNLQEVGLKLKKALLCWMYLIGVNLVLNPYWHFQHSVEWCWIRVDIFNTMLNNSIPNVESVLNIASTFSTYRVESVLTFSSPCWIFQHGVDIFNTIMNNSIPLCWIHVDLKQAFFNTSRQFSVFSHPPATEQYYEAIITEYRGLGQPLPKPYSSNMEQLRDGRIFNFGCCAIVSNYRSWN